MKHIYYLSTCDKCKRILSNISRESKYEYFDIKSNPISPEVLDHLANVVGSYEALFNKRAIKFKDKNLRLSIQSDIDYRNLILSEYTFLKRPIFINNDEVGLENPI